MSRAATTPPTTSTRRYAGSAKSSRTLARGHAARERSLITLGMLCALNRPHELRIHLTAAINNGCTVEEIRELFTHSVAYCGFPAAIDALRIAEEVLREKGLLSA